ncbi:MAG: recombinase family protein [Streptosporangiaceae bacterium]
MRVTTAAEPSGERWLIAARLSRMSKEDRARGDAIINGIKTQDQESARWLIDEGHTIVDVTRDRNVSGLKSPWDRPELGPWLTDPAKMGQYDGIVAYEANRLSRDYADLPMMRKWAEQHGKKLHVILERLDWPDDRDGRRWADAAEDGYAYVQGIKEKTTRELDALKAAGKLVGRPVWGYTSAGEKYDRRMVTAPEGEQYVPEMFTRTANGQALTVVAAWLSEQTGRAWHPRTVAAMIRNTAYRGQRWMTDSKGRKFVHVCPALVGDGLFRRANANLDARPSVRRGQRTDLVTGASLQSGLVTCGNPACDATGGPGSPMYKIVVSPTKDTRQAMYRCSGRGAQRKGCGFMVDLADADALLNRVMSGLRRPVMRPEFHPATGHQVKLDDIAQKLEDLPRKGLDDDAEDAERARLRAERRELTGSGKPAWTEFVPVVGDDGEPLTYGAKWLASDQAERRAWLRDAGFSVSLAKPHMLPASFDGDEGDGVLSTVDVWESDGAALVFRWQDDADSGLARGLVSDVT